MTGIGLLDYWRMGRARGWKYPVRYFVQSHLFDIVRGTNTHFWVSPTEYSRVRSADDAVHYVACPTRSIKQLLQAVRAHAGAKFGDFQFVDLGCGKGKTLLVYSEYTNFQHVWPAVGIEIVPELARVAQRNVEIMGYAERIRICTDDATAWRTSCAAAAAILFLYNPFGRETLDKALQAASDLECYVAYVDPEHSTLLQDRGWERTFHKTGTYKNECVEVWYRPSRMPASSSS